MVCFATDNCAFNVLSVDSFEYRTSPDPYGTASVSVTFKKWMAAKAGHRILKLIIRDKSVALIWKDAERFLNTHCAAEYQRLLDEL